MRPYLSILLVLIAAGCRPNPDPDLPEPDRVPAPVPVKIELTWTSVADGYGLSIHFEARGLTPDPDKVNGGWRIFESNLGDYKIIYSVDEWKLEMTSVEYREVNPGKLPYVHNGDGTKVAAEREPWWLYYNMRTGEFKFVYGEEDAVDVQDRPNESPGGRGPCATGNCPTGQGNSNRAGTNNSPRWRIGRSVRS